MGESILNIYAQRRSVLEAYLEKTDKKACDFAKECRVHHVTISRIRNGANFTEQTWIKMKPFFDGVGVRG